MKKNKIFLAAFIFQLLLISCSKNGGTDAGTNPVAPLPNVLTIQTNNATTLVAQTSAVIGGNIIADGGLAVTARGICWNTAPSPTILNNKAPAGSGIGSFTATISGLTYATTYYVRAYATNSTTTVYGAEVSFTTIPGNGVTDVDGNTYTTVILGDKEWMVQNLRTTKYQNGDVIPNITTQTLWSTTATGAWCYYNNTAGYNNTYGKLYNWYAATDPRQISPAGWHVPSSGEYMVLTAYLGGNGTASGFLKTTSFGDWASPNTGANNLSGFSALPGGFRYQSNSGFALFGTDGYWWTSELGSSSNGRHFRLEHNTIYNYINDSGKGTGLSIRCVKD
jgi:uncharacterized protein (TIGR02145 family)